MSSDNDADEAAMVFKDCKEVTIKHSQTTVMLRSAVINDGFIKLDPARNKCISRLLMSRCSKPLRSQIASEKNFWSRKDGSGKKLLGKLRGLQKTLLVKKFGFGNSARFLSRSKKFARNKWQSLMLFLFVFQMRASIQGSA